MTSAFDLVQGGLYLEMFGTPGYGQLERVYLNVVVPVCLHFWVLSRWLRW